MVGEDYCQVRICKICQAEMYGTWSGSYCQIDFPATCDQLHMALTAENVQELFYISYDSPLVNGRLWTILKTSYQHTQSWTSPKSRAFTGQTTS